MVSRSTWLLGVVIVCVLGVSLVGATATAKAPPEPVCGVCTDALEETAAEHGVALERGTTRMSLTPYPNGTTTATAVVTLETGAEQLANETRRTAIVENVSYIVADRRQKLTTRLVDKTLIVEYTAPNMTHTTAGVLWFDAFKTRGAPPFAAGGEGSPYPGADKLTLHAPAGYHIYGTYGTTNNNTTIVWRGTNPQDETITEDRTIVIVPAESAMPWGRVRIGALIDWLCG